MTSKANGSKVQKNPSTGRFEKAPAENTSAKLLTEDSIGSVAPHRQRQADANIANQIHEKADNVFKLSLALESAFFNAGIVIDTPLNDYYSEDECDVCDDDSPSPVDPCPYSGAKGAIFDGRNLFNRTPRAMTVVRNESMNAVSTLNYVLARGVYAMNGDTSNVDMINAHASRDTSGYAGWSETESGFADAANNSRNLMTVLSELLFAHDTNSGSEEADAQTLVSMSLKDHLDNVSDVLTTIHSHGEWLLADIRTNLE